MGIVMVGTSGYGYNEWLGPVYPEGASPEDFLPLYAGMLRTVELNASYRAMPTADGLRRLLSEAGPSLVFSLKANAALTRDIDPLSWKAASRAFRSALEPLRETGRLGAVLLQFPLSFGYEADRRRYLDALLSELEGVPLAAEFRAREWYNNRVLDALRSRGVAMASLDMPELAGLPPVMDVVTAPLAYVRLNGRNAAAWWGSDSASRYDYSYTEPELQAWAARARGMAAHADAVLVYFNNYRRGQSAHNAMAFARILERDE